MLRWNPELKFGDVLTAVSVLVALCGFLYAWAKDRRLKRREYADRIRRAAAETVVALDRWRQLAVELYDDIQPLLTDADQSAFKYRDLDKKNVIQVRDALWRELFVARAASSKRILDERIESAYLNLYGYEPRVQALYDSATASLKWTSEEAFSDLLYKTQANVLELTGATKQLASAELGNALRLTTSVIASALSKTTGLIVDTFRREMLRLIDATDAEIVNKSVRVAISLGLGPKQLQNNARD